MFFHVWDSDYVYDSVCMHSVTWTVAAQHPRLDQGSGDTDVVEETAVLAARLQPRACDQHLHATLRHKHTPQSDLKTLWLVRPWNKSLCVVRHMNACVL